MKQGYPFTVHTDVGLGIISSSQLDIQNILTIRHRHTTVQDKQVQRLKRKRGAYSWQQNKK